MVSENKIAAFLRLQQIVLDIEDETKLLEQFLPVVLKELSLAGYTYEFISAIFVDANYKLQQAFFIDRYNNTKSSGGIINTELLLQKGSSREMELMYGKPLVISDVAKIISGAYPNFSNIHSLFIFPIQNVHKFSGILVLARPEEANQVNEEESEFIEMINRLIDLAFRLQDTEESLTKITKQVYEMNAQLHQLDRLKDDFVSIASHELRTPMTAIRSYAWMALHRSDVPLSKILEKYLTRIFISTQRLINLVNDMLNVSRIESGRIEINPEPVDLLALAKDIVDELYFSKAQEKEIQFEVLPRSVPKVLADPEKLRQVLLNIVGNSLKFTPSGGKISFDFFSDGVVVETSITDTGVGISKDDLSRLFKKFSRLDNSYSAAATSGGTGLGLYISKNLVNLMHGKIWAYSAGVGKGMTITVSLPIATPDALREIDKFRVRPQGETKGLEPAAI